MFSLFDPTRGQAPTISTDRVIPLRRLDDLPHGGRTGMFMTLLFNDVLDPFKLRDGLETLATLKGWDKIGARFRYDRKGRLYYHIPAIFTEDRRAVHFCHIRHDMLMAEHTVASQMQKLRASQGPKIVADIMAFRSLWAHPSIPTKFSEYLQSDVPQLGLVVVSFRDATLVVLRWFHTLFDMPGMAELLRAWSSIVNGNLNQVSTPHDASEDPLADLGLHPTEPYLLEKLRLSRLQMMVFTIRALYNAVFKRYRSRVLCLPSAFLREIREEAESETASDEQRPFLSDDNLITAWWARLHTATEKNPRGTVNLYNALGLRRTLENDLLPPSKPYLSNAVAMSTLLLSAEEVINRPLSYTASRLRQCITESRTRPQVEAFSALVREKQGTLTKPMFGNATMAVLRGSSWTNAKLFDVDFTGAVLENASTSGMGASSARPGFPSYVQCTFNSPVRFEVMVTVGKDHEGNYWLNATTDDAHWERIVQTLETTRKV
ncbi:Transcriptional regulator sdnM [Metarhizium anisopliae]|nr:Transcriptional regulator sdnM [Metarhizium anisopliae]